MTTRIAYLRAINGLPIEVQRDMAKLAGCKVIFEHGDVAGKDTRELFKRRLGPGEIAWVASLAVLAKRRAELGSVRSGADLSAFVTDVIRLGHVIEIATKNMTSTDDGFPALLKATLQALHNAARDPQSVAASLKKARKVKAKSGMKAKWHMPEMREKFERQLALWQSSRFTTDKQAIAALHPELREMSPATARRFFEEGRRPKRKGMGGRASNKR